MGNGSSSSQQQRQSSTAEEHTYEEIQEGEDNRKGDRFNRFNRNCSIVTLDIKPGEWSRFAEAQKRSKEEDFGGRDVWWGEAEEGEHQSSRRRRTGYPELEQTHWTARSQEGGWDTSCNAGWRDEAVGPWPTYKRCVSLDVKQIDPKLDEKSEF